MEKKVKFPPKIMFCFSTQNQAVNLIPALMENVNKMVVFSTKKAKQDWTENFKKVLAGRDIKLLDEDDVSIEKCEQNVKELVITIMKYVKKYEDHEILLNIGGGQKIFTLAFTEVFRNSEQANIRMVYSEANTCQLYSIKKNLDQSHNERYRVNLSLEEILKFNGYELTEEKEDDLNWLITEEVDGVLKITDKVMKNGIYVVADKHNEYLKNDRLYQELFYKRVMKEDLSGEISYQDLIHGEGFKNIVEQYRPNTDPKQYTWTNRVLKKLEQIQKEAGKITEKNKEKTLEEIKKLADSIISPNTIGNNLKMYCNDLTNELKHNILQNNVVAKSRSFSEDEKNKVKTMFDDVLFDGNHLNKYSLPEASNGEFFEKMVTAEVCKLKDDPEAWQNIHEIWRNVKTKKIGNENQGNDAEYDVVIVTKFGTLILIEVKSAVFDNKIAKGQERDVFKKSGPYGKATIVGPLLREMLNTKAEERKEKYPFVTKTFYAQAEKVESAGMTYWCFDEICKKLKNELGKEELGQNRPAQK